MIPTPCWIHRLTALCSLIILSGCRPENLHLAGDWQCGDFSLALARDGSYLLRPQHAGEPDEVRGVYRVDQEQGTLRIRYDSQHSSQQRYVYVASQYPTEGFYLNTRPDLHGEPKLCLRRGGWA